MSEDTTAAMAAQEEQSPTQNQDSTLPPDDEPLREEGLKALQAWKQRAKEAEKEAKRAKQLEQKLSEYEEASKSEQEKLLDQAKKEAAEQARNEILGQVQRERLETSVVRTATGKLADPEDAIRFLDLDDLVDSEPEAISEAIDELIKSKPYLSSKAGATRPTGDADQGVRQTDKVPQLTREDLQSMSPQQIEAARLRGELNQLMGRV